MKKWLTAALCLLMLFTQESYSATKQIAITIDDLPFVGARTYSEGNKRREHARFLKLIEALDTYHVPTTGFVIAGQIGKSGGELLDLFTEHGYFIGNHTFTHPKLSQSNADKYIAEIEKADAVLTPRIKATRYFRYPYLAEGAGETKVRVQEVLARLNYVVAPVTVDSKDFQFNAQFMSIPWRARPAHLNSMKKCYLGYIWAQTLRAEKKAEKKGLPDKQILLLHANVLNSLFLGDILKMYKDNGYKFISLDEALK